jgi:hypothetical protein
MDYFERAPFVAKIFRHETAMTMLRFLFAAQKTGSVENYFVGFLYVPSRH